MTSLTKPRIESIDLLKGLVMVIMALDHVRDYFHYSANFFDPADPIRSNLAIFFTRWITHFCAPAFSFLAGVSAYMVGKRKSKSELSAFLIKRGLWLVFIELTVVGFAWYFDFQFRTFNLLVIWALGVSMIVLALLVHLPKTVILIFSLLLICGHNLLDNVHFPGSMLWSIMHEFTLFKLSDHTQLFVGYPLVPWVAVMSLGYYVGQFYDQSFDGNRRRKMFNIIGLTTLAVFILLRYTNLYGDPTPFKHFAAFTPNVISFFHPNKYPPSLLYLTMTLGGVFIFLANSEHFRGKVVDFFSMFGRVPFFYYVLHLFLIHILAMIFGEITGFGWQRFIHETWIGLDPEFRGWGFPLWVVYAVWIAVILLLYPLCKKFDQYKQAHREKWWLSYL